MELGRKLGQQNKRTRVVRKQVGAVIEGRDLPTSRMPAFGYMPTAKAWYEVPQLDLPQAARVAFMYLIDGRIVVYYTTPASVLSLHLREGVPHFGAFVYVGVMTEAARNKHLDACVAASDLVPFIDGTETLHAWSVSRSMDPGSPIPPSTLRDDFGQKHAVKIGSPALIYTQETQFLFR